MKYGFLLKRQVFSFNGSQVSARTVCFALCLNAVALMVVQGHPIMVATFAPRPPRMPWFDLLVSCELFSRSVDWLHDNGVFLSTLALLTAAWHVAFSCLEPSFQRPSSALTDFDLSTSTDSEDLLTFVGDVSEFGYQDAGLALDGLTSFGSGSAALLAAHGCIRVGSWYFKNKR